MNLSRSFLKLQEINPSRFQESNINIIEDEQNSLYTDFNTPVSLIHPPWLQISPHPDKLAFGCANLKHKLSFKVQRAWSSNVRKKIYGHYYPLLTSFRPCLVLIISQLYFILFYSNSLQAYSLQFLVDGFVNCQIQVNIQTFWKLQPGESRFVKYKKMHTSKLSMINCSEEFYSRNFKKIFVSLDFYFETLRMSFPVGCRTWRKNPKKGQENHKITNT